MADTCLKILFFCIFCHLIHDFFFLPPPLGVPCVQYLCFYFLSLLPRWSHKSRVAGLSLESLACLWDCQSLGFFFFLPWGFQRAYLRLEGKREKVCLYTVSVCGQAFGGGGVDVESKQSLQTAQSVVLNLFKQWTIFPAWDRLCTSHKKKKTEHGTKMKLIVFF